VRAVAPKPAAPAPTETGNAGAPTPADIINARGLWPDTVAKANQATPAQVAAIAAREALAAADTHPAPAVPAASPALAYAPASAVAPASRPTVVAAAAPVPLNLRPAVRNAMAAMPIDTVAIKGPQGPAGPVPTSARISAAKGGDIWLRAMILAPSASLSMASTVLGDTDMTVMRAYFVKPQSAVTMGFSDDPQMGLQCDRFTGSATATLTTISFVLRTASLH
jgi:hypothetical protein